MGVEQTREHLYLLPDAMNLRYKVQAGTYILPGVSQCISKKVHGSRRCDGYISPLELKCELPGRLK